ncbi:SMI1/KNR4 family protein [Nocardiopsis valliformis]|uniref:SMI1/KNR4 family protein n=1 Tax=Nocardiopsis valliformis TaxID=239974 RepID=UPI0012697B86|nr:SMI1/KNR4 family protein [Nocardiopsis valliformis]
MLSSEIEVLMGKLSLLGRPVVGQLVPGSNQSRVSEFLGSDVPDDVKTWFAWCDGVDCRAGQSQDDINIIPGYYPLSLVEAMEVKSDHEGDPVLDGSWIPLLGGGGGDMYAALWSPGQDPVVAGSLVGEMTEIEFSSLGQAVRFFNECYEAGAFGVNEQGQLYIDPASYDELYETLHG